MDEDEMLRRIDAAVADVEKRCEPDDMTKAEAVDYLETVISHLQMSIEALREEMGNA
jgi:hypothetical protein